MNTAEGSFIVLEKDIHHLLKKDKVIASIYKKYGAPPNWSRPQGFVSLSKIILEQQVSLASALAHFNKLNNYIPSFTPKNILNLTDEEMRTCQISRQKAKYLRCLSTAILEKEIDLEKLSILSENKIREKLTAIKGIGTWTTDIYLMFCLQAKNIFPVGDIAVINTIKELYGLHEREKIIRMTKKWEPNKSLGTYFMWHYYLEKRKK
jgi:DNA-3-methyladenine glycosylase II